MIVGEPQTGKTCICKQVVSDGTNFLRNYLMTHALDVSVKSINIPDTNDVIEMYLLDCSGRYVFEKTSNYVLPYLGNFIQFKMTPLFLNITSLSGMFTEIC